MKYDKLVNLEIRKIKHSINRELETSKCDWVVNLQIKISDIAKLELGKIKDWLVEN